MGDMGKYPFARRRAPIHAERERWGSIMAMLGRASSRERNGVVWVKIVIIVLESSTICEGVDDGIRVRVSEVEVKYWEVVCVWMHRSLHCLSCVCVCVCVCEGCNNAKCKMQSAKCNFNSSADSTRNSLLAHSCSLFYIFIDIFLSFFNGIFYRYFLPRV